MKYTKYFSIIISSKGQPHLSDYQYQRFMNIVFVEGVIEGLQKANKQLNNRSFDILIFKYQKKLTDLTGHLKPEQLIKEMVSYSN